MDNIDQVGKTAFIVAQWRVDQEENKAPLFVDNVAKIFLNEEIKKLAEKVAQIKPNVKDNIQYRTKYFDEQMTKAFAFGVKQVIIIGAGLDTRSTRFMEHNAKFIEIDKEEVLAFKKQRLKEEGYAQKSVYIPGDYIKDDLFSLLEKSQTDLSASTFVIWEGNTMYLPKENVKSLLSQMGQKFAKVHIAFDYLCARMINKKAKLTNTFNAMGAPWITGFDNIEELANEVSLKVIESYSMIDLEKKYYSKEDTTDDYYYVCTLGNYLES